ncbi:guanitoxin biosynthesis L-enduracididine beta-hydroxylase GntD [Acrocarpospora catenulata]|uniref:guanitoxin biosynthesis L-enduracididine beta-hydroxylase GntD n=1 Tax=Acrocarpospora catenulata TaxID=2836182 RepID=UPI001BD92AA8|nr:guanitoxin biosynthesis L-enduracididine beta-hydroxylase GntD [Acrocarpospora catenulata]
MSADTVEYLLDDKEVDAILAIADRVRALQEDPADPGFYDRCWHIREELPVGLRRFLEDFRRTEPAEMCLVHGFPVDDAALGPTPGHWSAAGQSPAAGEVEIFLALCGMVLGEPFAWSTLQGGRMIQNIVPIKGDERRQSGHGSQSPLEFHTEDGFHPLRCDYLLLFGLRNQDGVATTISSVRDLELAAEDEELLSRPGFHIRPDDEHLRQLELRQPGHPALELMRRMRSEPEAVPVLIGDRRSPYLRIDRPFMSCVGDDPAAEQALDALMAELEAKKQDVVVGQGSLLVVDNYLAVHGRSPFLPRYDGTDRWLKKLTVSRNLRRSIGNRATESRRVIF